MKNKELIIIYKSLTIFDDLQGIKFAFFILKLKEILENEMKNLDAVNPLIKDGFKEKQDDEKESLLKEFNELLDTENGVVLPTINLSELPSNITVRQLDVLKPLVKE